MITVVFTDEEASAALTLISRQIDHARAEHADSLSLIRWVQTRDTLRHAIDGT